MPPLVLSLATAVLTVAVAAVPQTFPTEPKTGRAIGAVEMSPADVARELGTRKKVVIIDVREPAQFEKETIKGAINIPLERLEDHLNDYSKDTLLVFT